MCGSENTPESSKEPKLSEELTKEEDLQKLYKKYGITENDIKFALKGKLPYYLKGTVRWKGNNGVQTHRVICLFNWKNISVMFCILINMLIEAPEISLEEQKKYAGKHVAIIDGKIVASGDTAKETFQ